jgi:MFS family permease
MGVHDSFWNLLPAMLLGGVGMAAAMAPTTAAAMASVRPDKAGVGSAVLNSMRQVGGSLGIAIMGAIVASGISSSLASGHSRPEAFVHGFRNATSVAALIAIAGAIVAVTTLQHARHREPARDSVPEAA